MLLGCSAASGGGSGADGSASWSTVLALCWPTFLPAWGREHYDWVFGPSPQLSASLTSFCASSLGCVTLQGLFAY